MNAARSELPASTPWPVQFAALVLNKGGITGLLLVAAFGVLAHQVLYVRPKIDEKIIGLLQTIATHEKIQTCVITGGLDEKRCNLADILTGGDGSDRIASAAEPLITGTIGGISPRTP